MESKIYVDLAERHYKDHKNYKKALAAATAMDNALTLKYTKDGHTNTHFMLDNYLKYFDYNKLPKSK